MKKSGEEKKHEEEFVNDWLRKGESFTIKGRLKYIVKYKHPLLNPSARRCVASIERFDRCEKEESDANPWKAVEIDFTYGRNEDDGGRQFRPFLRFVEEPFEAYEVCTQADEHTLPASWLPRAGPKDRILVLDTMDQYVGGKIHEHCARALVTIRDAGHRNKADLFFEGFVNMKHRVLDVPTRVEIPLMAKRREDTTTHGCSSFKDLETEAARFGEMLRQIDERVTSIARDTLAEGK